MSTVTLPPTGAKVRATITYPDGTVGTLEGIATAVSESFIDLGAGHAAIRLKPEGGATVAVEVLALPVPAEPGDGEVVKAGWKVFLRQITATHGPEMSWWRTGEDGPYTWAEVCGHGTPVRLIADPAADAPETSWQIGADTETRLNIKPYRPGGNALLMMANPGAAGVSAARTIGPADCRAAAAVLLRIAADAEAGQQ